MSEIIIIICDECGKEVKNPNMFEKNRWLKIPAIGGARDLCPDCRNKYDFEDLANRIASRQSW